MSDSDTKYSIWDYVGAILVAVVTGVISLQVLSRYVFKMPLAWPKELARYIFVWIVMIGSVAAAIRGGHFILGVTQRLPSESALRRIIGTVVDLSSCAFLALLAFYGGKLAWTVRAQLSPAMQVSMAVMYSAVPIGAILMLVSIVSRRVSAMALTRRKGD